MKLHYTVLLLIISSSILTSVQAANNTDHENKLNAVANLLTKSTISKQVLHSNNEAAIQYYRFAKSLYDDAVNAYKQGDIEKSSDLLKKSRYALIDAVEFANLQGAKQKRGKNNYEALRKSANALIDALNRVSEEKGNTDKYQDLLENAQQQLSKSDQLYFSENYNQAITLLGQTIQSIKTAISEMRSGDTLVKPLKFASAKEEYKYEVDRNITHFMLLDMFLTENPQDQERLQIMENQVKLAKSLREQAEGLASSHKHKEAIPMLEKSTSIIIGLIRNTGVYIPNQ